MFGILTTIDLKFCDPILIRDAAVIENFVKELITLIKMKAYGEPQIVHFGSCPEVEGFSLVQFIETSLISGHFVNLTSEAFIDIFSCKSYDANMAAAFAKSAFSAKESKHQVIIRG
jgi:S-adenosylmethionine/arginine decarboxylase-like enzyme